MSTTSRQQGATPLKRDPPILLWLTENYYPSQGGMARSCDRIVASLRAMGMAVDLVHLRKFTASSAPVVQPALHGCDVRYPVGEDASHGLNQLFEWLRSRSEFRPPSHVVAFGGRLPITAGPVFAQWLEARLVTLFRGNDFDASVFDPARRKALDDAVHGADVVGAVTREKTVKLERMFPQKKIVYTPNGIDASWRRLPSDEWTARAWRASGTRAGKVVFGFFGHLKRKKGVDFFLKALGSANGADRVHVHMVGELEAEVDACLRESEWPFTWTQVPFRDRLHLTAEYAKCDFVVLPSFYDGMPNVLLESGALGIPLIASRAGGMPDILEAGRDGFLFRTGDAADCAACIEGALQTTTEERQCMGEMLSEKIAGHYSHHREAAIIGSLFETTAIHNPVITS